MAKAKGTITEYRNYYLPLHFPVLLLSDEHWKISDIPSGRQHFHNCLEIGICHSDSGVLEVFSEPLAFRAGDVTVIPQNVPHTTYSSPGQSLVIYLHRIKRLIQRTFSFHLAESGFIRIFSERFSTGFPPGRISAALSVGTGNYYRIK